MTNNMNVWNVIEQNLAIPGNYIGLYGPPGTGKTFIAASGGLPKDGVIVQVSCVDDGLVVEDDQYGLFSLTLTDGASEAEIRGHYIPTADGGMWIDGPGALAWKLSHHMPVRFVVNEIDRASDEVLSLLYAIADDPTSPGTMLTLPNEEKEHIRPGKMFTIVATMNGVPEDLPEALQDRFSWIAVNEVNPAALAVLPADLRAHAASAALADDARRISIRKWLAFARLMEAGMVRDMAAYTAFGATKYLDVLDSIGAAGIVARIAAFAPDGVIENSHFDERFTPHEGINISVDYWCGWCQTNNCGETDAACTPMRFVNAEEWEDFCSSYGLSTEDDVDYSTEVWKASMLHRTFSKQMDEDNIDDLASLSL